MAEPRLLRLADAAELDSWLNTPERLGTALPAQVIGVGGDAAGAALARAAQDALERATAAQQALHARLRAAVLGHYAEKTAASWRERYRAGLASAGTPDRLRVLIPISRYSTFVRHSAHDLAEALRTLGHHAEVLSEPDPHSKLTTPAYLGAIDRLRPDLVVLINHTRRHMGQAVPPGVPMVCWVQDRMAHLFDASCGASQGELDFLFGHLHLDLFSHFNYPRQRRGFSFVPASAARFGWGPAPAAFEAEIAYVSHQSETPQRLHARLVPMFAASPAVTRCLEGLFASASRWLDRAQADRALARSDRKTLVIEALAAAGVGAPDPRLVGAVFANYLVPVMERMARHRALEWARRVCDRRGWRLRLHGRGWEMHPTLAAHAAGEAEHGTGDLSRLYRSSAVHLHVSMNTNAHQRVYECALAGGLMLRRGPSPDADLGKVALMQGAALGPRVGVDAGGTPVYEAREGAGDAEWALHVNGYHRAMGRGPARDDRGVAVYRRALTEAQRTDLLQTWPRYPMGCMPDFAFPDGHETMFHDEAELEALVERALTDPSWREAAIAGHRRVVLERCTYDVAARRMLGLVASGLGVVESGAAR